MKTLSPKMASSKYPRDYVAEGLAYAQAVAAGKVVAGKLCRLACQRHLRDLRRSNWQFAFVADHANDVCDFIEKLPHVEGSWKTKDLRLEPVQIFILTTIFGWRRVADGGRRFSTVYIEAARKFAKSTLSAAVSLYCLTCEGEVGPQIVVGATTGEQASKVFLPAKRMVERTPLLREAFELDAWARAVSCRMNGGTLQPINAKGKTQDGWNPSLAVLDELHAHPDRALFDVIRSSFGARKNPLLWIITTAGYNTAGVCYEQRSAAVKVLEGVIDLEHLFAIIFTIDEKDDPFDERVWVKANPMLGITPSMDSMRAYAADAKVSPGDEGEFKTKRLNVWMSSASAWLNSQQWMSCADPSLLWDDFEGLDCYVGADLADKDDITALVLAAFDSHNRLICKPVFWLPSAVLDDPKHAEGRGPAPYRTWTTQGHITLTPGDWVDHNEVEEQIEDWLKRFSVRAVTFDQFAAAQAMASRLNEKHATPDKPLATVMHKKSATTTDPCKEIEARVKGGAQRLRHDGNPVMNWMASNVVVARRRDETILPIKENAMSPNKIDGIDALVNAIAPAVLTKKGREPEYRMLFV